MRSLYEYCDPPEMQGKSHWAVDLDAVFGKRCNPNDAGKGGFVAGGVCCYIPLGYGGGFIPWSVDSSCEVACNTYNREGADSAFCVRSDHSPYGNW